MPRRLRVRITLLAGLGGVAALTVLTAAGPPASEPEDRDSFRPVAPVGVLMYWQDRALGQINLGLVKKDRERVEKHAWLLAELANVNSRRKPDPRYRSWALDLREKAASIARLAHEGNFAEGKVAARAAKAVCKKCHDVFRED